MRNPHTSSSPRLFGLAAAAMLVSLAPLAQADADAPIVRSADTTISRLDWEADLYRIPADKRAPFASNPKRVETELNNLLVTKTLAARARAAGLDKDAHVRRFVELEADRALAGQWLDKVEADAGADFDRDVAKWTERARELYVVDRSKYKQGERVLVSHILFDPKKRGGDEAALAAAKAKRAELLAGADFHKIAEQESDETAARTRSGKLGWIARGKTVPEFEKAAFALPKGEISEPVKSSFGYHLILVEDRVAAKQQTFDEAKPQILAELRARFISDRREDAVKSVTTDPNLVVDRDALESLVTPLEIPPTAANPAPKPAAN